MCQQLLRPNSREMVLRCRPSWRAISACDRPCFLRCERIYLSLEVSCVYFIAVDHLCQELIGQKYRSLPPLEGAVLHLVYESKMPNKRMLADWFTAALQTSRKCGR